MTVNFESSHSLLPRFWNKDSRYTNPDTMEKEADQLALGATDGWTRTGLTEANRREMTRSSVSLDKDSNNKNEKKDKDLQPREGIDENA